MVDWIEWKGGKCPVRDGLSVEVRYRPGAAFGEEERGYGEGGKGTSAATQLRWDHTGSWGDIIAYRIVEPKP